MYFKNLAISNPEELIFGTAPKPVTTPRGLVIGGGTVYPELNFTLPTMEVSMGNIKEVQKHYEEIARDALTRAVELHSPGVVLEFETLLEMTQDPQIGISVVKILNDICEEFYSKFNLKSEIRLTPNDLREFERPPKQRTSGLLNPMMELFEAGAEAGGNLLSIESTGGKEVSDDALIQCNIKQFVFALAVLGVRDMKMLWQRITAIAEKTGKIPGGDTACGFGNTAMVLAERGYIPRVFAAIARIVTVVRTLVAIEEGARGPDKDCGYEGPYLKAITGTPISMEGKTSACAHFSPVGNVTAACADLWSNESVQNIKLLSGMAPTVYMEQLEYDCRLMNAAIKSGAASSSELQRLFVLSDIHLDPQALILAPEVVIEISKEILKGKNYIEAAVLGALKGLEIIKQHIQDDLLTLDEKEHMWIDMIGNDLSTIPMDESKFVSEMMEVIPDGKFIPNEYGL